MLTASRPIAANVASSCSSVVDAPSLTLAAAAVLVLPSFSASWIDLIISCNWRGQLDVGLQPNGLESKPVEYLSGLSDIHVSD